MKEQSASKTQIIDLVLTLKKILKKWKFILIFCFLGGLISFGLVSFIPKTYTAISIISLNTASLPSVNLKPISIVGSDFIEEKVSEQVSIPIEDLPTVNLSNERNTNDNTIVRIRIQGTDAKQVKEIVDAWAEIAVDWVLQTMEEVNLDMIEAQTSVEEADQVLLAFLNDHNIDGISWNELLSLTGVGEEKEITIVNGQQELPELSSEELFTLTQIVRKKYFAEWLYTIRAKQYYANSQTVSDKALVLNYSDSVQELVINAKSRDNIYIAIGVFTGLILAVMWIIISEWGKSILKEINKHQ